jgi:putative flippase GtrA
MIKIIKFCIVGGINTLITLTLFYTLNKILGVNYIFSTVIGYLIGMVNSYILNKKWTFHDDNKRVVFQFAKFAVFNSISLGINLFIMYIFVDKLYLDSMLSQICATGFSTLSNFIGSKIIVFPCPEEKSQLS